jgi:arsenate reductase
VFRVLFVDDFNSCRSQMAEAIGSKLGQAKFVFTSAGLDRRPVDARTVAFLKDHGFDVSNKSSKTVDQVPHFEHYQVIVALAKDADRVFPAPPTKAVCLEWHVPDPSQVEGPPEAVQKAYEETFRFLDAHIRDLVEAVLGDG